MTIDFILYMFFFIYSCTNIEHLLSADVKLTLFLIEYNFRSFGYICSVSAICGIFSKFVLDFSSDQVLVPV